MVSPAFAHDDPAFQAAELAAAILRFQEPLAHLATFRSDKRSPIIGVDAYAFAPSPRLIPRDQVSGYLAALPSPAVLAPTTIRGVIALTMLHELSGERRAAMQHQLDNQMAALETCAHASADDRVLLEFDDESLVLTLGAVRVWAQRYGVLVGWNLTSSDDPARAKWRLNLVGGDGQRYSRGYGRSRDA